MNTTVYLKGILPLPIVILCLLLQFNPRYLYAQNLGFGIRAGAGASTHFNDFKFLVDDEQISLSPGISESFDAGIVYRKIIADNWRIQIEPSVIRIGATFDETVDNEDAFGGFEIRTDSKTNIWYAYFPLLVQLTTTPPDRLEFPKPWASTTYHITFGLYGNYLIDATFKGTNSGAPLGVDFRGDFKEDVSEQYRDIGAGVILGGGFEHGLNDKFGLELRGIFGALDAGGSDQLNFNPLNIAVTVNMYYLF